jgi:hypothetical protein
MATSVAFASAVNSFCHFHTPLTLTLWRVFNGLWVGSLFGLFVGLLLWLVVKVTAKFRIQEEGEFDQALRRRAVRLYGFGKRRGRNDLHAIVELAHESGLKKDRILALSASPRQTEEELSISFGQRWRPESALRALRESRTLLLGGGGLLQDVTSLRSPLYYWGVVMESRIAGCRPWAFGQSVGPFHKKSPKG